MMKLLGGKHHASKMKHAATATPTATTTTTTIANTSGNVHSPSSSPAGQGNNSKQLTGTLRFYSELKMGAEKLQENQESSNTPTKPIKEKHKKKRKAISKSPKSKKSSDVSSHQLSSSPLVHPSPLSNLTEGDTREELTTSDVFYDSLHATSTSPNPPPSESNQTLLQTHTVSPIYKCGASYYSYIYHTHKRASFPSNLSHPYLINYLSIESSPAAPPQSDKSEIPRYRIELEWTRFSTIDKYMNEITRNEKMIIQLGIVICEASIFLLRKLDFVGYFSLYNIVFTRDQLGNPLFKLSDYGMPPTSIPDLYAISATRKGRDGAGIGSSILRAIGPEAYNVPNLELMYSKSSDMYSFGLLLSQLLLNTLDLFPKHLKCFQLTNRQGGEVNQVLREDVEEFVKYSKSGNVLNDLHQWWESKQDAENETPKLLKPLWKTIIDKSLDLTLGPNRISFEDALQQLKTLNYDQSHSFLNSSSDIDDDMPEYKGVSSMESLESYDESTAVEQDDDQLSLLSCSSRSVNSQHS